MSSSNGKILIIDDDVRIARMLGDVLEEHGYGVETAATAKEGLAKARDGRCQAVLLDLKLPDKNGRELLGDLLVLEPNLPVIIISAYGDITTAVEAVKAGAFDFLEKPISTDRLLLTLKHALEQRKLQNYVERLENEAGGRYRILGRSPAINKVLTLIDKAAAVKSGVLITGENGTGKELAARAIHYRSPRQNRPFVKINCAAIPDSLMESELFGYEKGSFTGAVSAKKGRLEAADGGTVFLDEIGDMSLATQSKLLRFLQEGEIEKLGAVAQRMVDVRVIAATNQELETAVKEKRFREDLYYRLNVIVIKMPPLRERREDIPLLAQTFLAEACNQNGLVEKTLTEDSLRFLTEQSWLGNVRQLKNLMERVAVLSERQVLEPADFLAVMHEGETEGGVKEKDSEGTGESPSSIRKARDSFERSHIISVLDDNKWNMARTAKILGIDRANLYRKMRRLGIGTLEKKRERSI